MSDHTVESLDHRDSRNDPKAGSAQSTDRGLETLNARISALEAVFLIKDLTKATNQGLDPVAYAAEQSSAWKAIGQAFHKNTNGEHPTELEQAFERLSGIMETMAKAVAAQTNQEKPKAE